MRVLVCGGRNFGNHQVVRSHLDAMLENDPDAVVIQGGVSGADALARQWCSDKGVLCRSFYARWDLHGKAAGPIRNQQMIDEGKPHVVLAMPGGRGTADMVRRARTAGIEVVEVPPTPQAAETTP